MTISLTQIVCLGLSHHTAPVALREQLSCSLTDLNGLLQTFREETALGENGRFPGINELVILSTCNRVELYAHVDAVRPHIRQLLTQFLSELRGVDTAVFANHLYFYTGQTAIDYLMRVTAGLDSLVLGEPQILGQVNSAYTAAAQTHAAGPVLRRLFEAAIRAGKRARTETAISSNPASISSVAIALAQTAAGSLADKTAVIIGAGEMAELALKALQARQISAVTVVNRTCPRAQLLTDRLGGTARGLDELGEQLLTADIVISATGAPHFILDAALIERLMEKRNGRALVLIDIAVPRDIDPQAALIPGVILFDVDDLQDKLDKALAARQREVPRVEAIIAEEQTNLTNQLRELAAKPFITDLRQKAEEIRQRELERTLRHLGDVDPQVAVHLQYLSRSLVNKLLHEPTIRVKEQASNGRSAEYVATARHLFGLEEAREES
ncbi:MAG: glutamyl-tRNA reductase [Ardenticatenaceae bacterium]|nr:glutamyl-tRNA reductase [Ardenticatenaceae bacterium]MCB9444886.1 glutamyl-tRNA reductase [Ardenticatenaceae bacterium]